MNQSGGGDQQIEDRNCPADIQQTRSNLCVSNGDFPTHIEQLHALVHLNDGLRLCRTEQRTELPDLQLGNRDDRNRQASPILHELVLNASSPLQVRANAFLRLGRM